MASNLTEWEQWLDRGKTALVAANTLVDERLLADAVSRIYYAMFYATKALFTRDGLAAKRHASVLTLFGREYVKTNIIAPEFHQMLIKAFELRQKSDYDIYWEMTLEDAQTQLAAAKQFMAEIEKILETKI
jgi:uncharacterized protein (UPF0332 family)